MPVYEVHGKQYEVDEDGFLQRPELWTKEVALDFAASEGLSDLSDGQWRILNYIRDYWQENDIAPMIRRICKDTGFKLSDIWDMFPSGPAKGACKVAGLPKPTGCV